MVTAPRHSGSTTGAHTGQLKVQPPSPRCPATSAWPLVSMVVELNARQHEREAAVRGGDAGEVVAGPGDHRVVEGVDLVQHPQGRLHGRGLAHRPAEVGLQRVAEAAVGVLVGTQRGHHWRGGTATEQVREAEAVDEPRVQPGEPLGRLQGAGIEHLGHGRSLARRSPPVLNGSDTDRQRRPGGRRRPGKPGSYMARGPLADRRDIHIGATRATSATAIPTWRMWRTQSNPPVLRTPMAAAMKLPISAPRIPRTTVSHSGMLCLPGTIALAISPMTSPAMMIQMIWNTFPLLLPGPAPVGGRVPWRFGGYSPPRLRCPPATLCGHLALGGEEEQDHSLDMGSP